MRRTGAFLMAALIAVPAAGLSLSNVAPTAPVTTSGSGEALLEGCGDVPEVVKLVEDLRLREGQIALALKRLSDLQSNLSSNRELISAELKRLKSLKANRAGESDYTKRAVDEDIARVVAVYEAMKPKEAALVIGSMPPDFSSELLMRVSPEASAKIMASIPPDQAATLTAFMGARRVKY